MANSEHCPDADRSVRILKKSYSLRDIVKLEEYAQLKDAITTAWHKDNDSQ